MERDFRIKKAYTLVELTISIAILSSVMLTALTTFSNVVRSRDRISKENLLYNESRLVMEILTQAIKDHVVDYSENYNQNVLGGAFGGNYNIYATRFVNPGENCTDFSDGNNSLESLLLGVPPNDLGPCGSTTAGRDQWTGYNPYSADKRPEVAYNENYASAFCDDSTYGSLKKCTGGSNLSENLQMYLISTDGREKTIFVRELIPDSNDSSKNIWVLAYVQMDGKDSNNDSLIDQWTCSSKFTCTVGLTPNKDDFNQNRLPLTSINQYYEDFVPLSSFDINITDLKFYISPLEDPGLASSEEASKRSPVVMIAMTTELADKTGFVQPLTLHLQSTVSPEYAEIETYKIK
ncbi:MAG: hypothetical protein UR28_C0003G0003 [Candidatus Peregrinibacteria bacterium GW2011_GWF2_33_10]|nr:MAG: hypothetical protein UR28_C0003G0003 [Candidatus Peregrinibacteria bacterium GW2011_GWF2_33_10]OGJ44029.1 MAG: hypothetical protein A2272_01275 [Candidatus Peregrinibacteria bacterium RIFOXYA12_FULL_33_12]OGJ44159.1 MAG: hypothetical protein A2263_04245 [Candidatus Peregrinibacteria bacterium RIFOXYA2_FULL_33_21]OGJ51788.1 MAG: hypothetical protein A2307_04910 [Candidatus Peregrinibacteria bacterium RIFOXYB2_FULL_33_20]